MPVRLLGDAALLRRVWELGAHLPHGASARRRGVAVEQIERWRDPEVVPEVIGRVRSFLRAHQLVSAT